MSRCAPCAGVVAVAALLSAIASPAPRAAAPSAPPNAETPAPLTRDGYRLAVPPYAFHFPRDHASHPAFRIEWWYYTGGLASGAREFGFELTFFRVGLDRDREHSRSAWAPHTVYFAHAALTDETRRTFRFDEAAARPALGLAGADSTRYRVWVGDWSAGHEPDGHTHRLTARAAAFALALELDPLKPPAVHGRGGVSRKGADPGEASHYYSITRLAARGTVALGRDTLPVRGEAWMDHEFSSSVLGPSQVGWDWFALRLDDGRDVMLYLLRLADGGIDAASAGSLVDRDGRVTPIERSEFSVTATGRWRSSTSGAVYPRGWRVELPGHGLALDVAPTVDDQELVTRAAGGVTYWEGSVRVRGVAGERPVRGRGYVELTGYAGPPPGR